MKRAVYAVAVLALCGAALSAGSGQTTPRTSAAAPSKPAASHPPTQPSPQRAAPSSPKPAPSHRATPAIAPAIEAQNTLVAQYCATCHSEKGKAGDLSLAGFDAAKVTDRADVAENMIRKLRAGMMPPPGSRRPDAATASAFVNALETTLDAAAA